MLVPGDVNSTLAAALCAAKLGIAVAPRRVRACAASTARCPRRSTGSSPTTSPSSSSCTRDEAIENLRARGDRRVADEVRRQHDDRHAGRARGAVPRARARPRALGVEPGQLPARHAAPAGARRRPAARRRDGAPLARWRASCRSSSRSTRGPARCSTAPTTPGSHADRPGRLPRLPLARGRRGGRAHRLRRDPGGDDLPRRPLLHAARQHRAAGDDPRRDQHAARARPGADRGDPGAAASAPRSGRGPPRTSATEWDGQARSSGSPMSLADW